VVTVVSFGRRLAVLHVAALHVAALHVAALRVAQVPHVA
jgi:hypothetical protein